MKHVFVESNWVVEAFAPSSTRTPEAESLLTRARSGELTLHVPSIALREGEAVIRSKYPARVPRELRAFRSLDTRLGALERDVVDQFLERYVQSVRSNALALSRNLDQLATTAGVDVFPLNDASLRRVLELRGENPGIALKPFDEAILAAVLVRVGELACSAYFCTLDADFLPRPTNKLSELYAIAGVDILATFQVPLQAHRRGPLVDPGSGATRWRFTEWLVLGTAFSIRAFTPDEPPSSA